MVFAVSNRQNLVRPAFKDELYKFMTGIVQRRKHKLIAINGIPNHVHLLIGLHPDMAISALVRDVKAGSSGFVNRQRWVPGNFQWQTGYGVFSHSHDELGRIARYIERQEEHHKARTFKQEHLAMLKRYEVEYDPQYLFTWIDDETDETDDTSIDV